MSVIEPHSQKLQYIFDNAKVGIAICNAEDNRLEMVNPAFAAIHGYEPHELIGVSPAEVFAPECMIRLSELENTPSACSMGDVSFETTHIRKDGSPVPVSVHITVVKDEHGVVKQRIANIIDISERIQAESELRMTTERFNQIYHNSPDVIYLIEVTPEGRFIHLDINQAFVEASGMPREMIVGVYVDEIEPEVFRDILLDKYGSCLRAGKKTDYINDYPLTSGVRTFHSLLTPLFDECGRLHQIIGIARDITEQKQQENHLRESADFIHGILGALPDLLFEVTLKGIYLNVWTSSPELLAVQREYLIGRSISDILSPEASHIAMEAICIANKNGKSIGHQIWIDLSSGREWFELSISKLPANEGSESRFLVLSRDISERKRKETKIEHLANHDALTGLANRSLAKNRTEQIIATSKRDETKNAFLFVDLDGFKEVNDSLGHSIGDAMLKSVASRLKECVRESDVISRQGGDEFLIILSQISGESETAVVAQKILAELEKPFEINTHTLSISCSIGISLFPDHGASFESLLQSADTAMYKAKETGRNSYCFYTQQMNHNIIGQFKLQNDLKKALQEGEFILHYQPQIDLNTNRIIGAEALIRWRHPQLGMIPPMQFIPLAETSGLIVPIGQWVIEEACRQAALWHKNGIEITIAVNISAVQFKRGNLKKVVVDALAKSHLNPKYLELELTESIMMHDVASTIQTVHALKALGLQLSIDDFGTGYSSLAYLKRFSVDKLKIDQSFVRDILSDREDAAIVKAIVQMASSLNLKTIAEGVETGDVLALIERFGCDEVQGYYFAKPLEAESLENYYQSFIDNDI